MITGDTSNCGFKVPSKFWYSNKDFKITYHFSEKDIKRIIYITLAIKVQYIKLFYKKFKSQGLFLFTKLYELSLIHI